MVALVSMVRNEAGIVTVLIDRDYFDRLTLPVSAFALNRATTPSTGRIMPPENSAGPNAAGCPG